MRMNTIIVTFDPDDFDEVYNACNSLGGVWRIIGVEDPIYRKVPCEHGQMKSHRAPDENSYAATYLCKGGRFVTVGEEQT